MTQRTENPTEIQLKAPYTSILLDETKDNPLAIEMLLNRPPKWETALAGRRKEFGKICAAEAMT
jgi:hypothetical protein